MKITPTFKMSEINLFLPSKNNHFYIYIRSRHTKFVVLVGVRSTIVIGLASASASSSVDKNFNLGHNLWTTRDRTFIFHMYIPCDNTFHIIP